MSDTFDPGPGWRELEIDAVLTVDIGPVLTLARFEGPVKRWVREAPTPQLPTAPYTVIRAWWGTELYTDLILGEDSVWRSMLKSGYDAEDLAQIVRFEVLSEPRAVTAKAVIDRVRDTGVMQLLLLANPANGDELDQIARHFGVES